MLTKTNPNGTWNVAGVDFKDCTGNMYGALCKLRDYESTGFEPDDLFLVRENVHIGSRICGYTVFVIWTIDRNGFGVIARRYFGNIQLHRQNL